MNITKRFNVAITTTKCKKSNKRRREESSLVELEQMIMPLRKRLDQSASNAKTSPLWQNESVKLRYKVLYIVSTIRASSGQQGQSWALVDHDGLHIISDLIRYHLSVDVDMMA